MSMDPCLEAPGEKLPVRLILMRLAMSIDLLFLDNNPGEHVQFLQFARVTFLFAVLMVEGGANNNKGAVHRRLR